MHGESLEVNARNVDDAIRKATELTGSPREDLEISVLTEGKSGLFGIGAEDARILVSVKVPPVADVAPDEPQVVTEVSAPPANPDTPAGTTETDGDSVARSAPLSDENAEEAKNVLLDLLDLIGMDTDVEIQRNNSALILSVIGEDLGLLIGRRGDTLTSLQFVLNLIIAKRLKRWARVIVDVEGYRQRREQTLGGLAKRVAFRVQQSGQPVALEAMPAAERRIIHMALADDPAVITGSVGEGDHRKVIISPRR